MIAAVLTLAMIEPAQGIPTSAKLEIAPYVREAAQKTGVSEPVIWAVIAAESAGKRQAVSPQGAAGLMQLMPKTWTMLRGELGLGSDVLDPRDNILAGTYYLRFLYDRYGWDGMFAAYNAGPARYEAHRDGARSLPTETQKYVASIAKKLSGERDNFGPAAEGNAPIRWAEAGLFVTPLGSPLNAPPAFTAAYSPFVTLFRTDQTQGD